MKKVCHRRPSVVIERNDEITTYTSVDGFGECLGSRCAAWQSAKPLLRNSLHPEKQAMEGRCGLTHMSDQFPDPALKEEPDG